MGWGACLNASSPTRLPPPTHPPPHLQDALGGLMGSPTGLSSSLANQLEAAVPLGALDAALAQLQDAVNLCSSIASLWPLLDVVADLQAVQASLNATAPQLEGALAAGDQYLALCYPGGGAPAPAWATLVGEVQGAAGEVGDAVAQAPADTSDSDQARAAWLWGDGCLWRVISAGGIAALPRLHPLPPLQDWHKPLTSLLLPSADQQVPALLALLPELHSSLVEQQGAISDVQALLVSVPDVAPYLSGLAEPAAPYSELPQPPHQLAAAAEADLEALLQGVLMVSGQGVRVVTGVEELGCCCVAAAGWAGRGPTATLPFTTCATGAGGRSVHHQRGGVGGEGRAGGC